VVRGLRPEARGREVGEDEGDGRRRDAGDPAHGLSLAQDRREASGGRRLLGLEVAVSPRLRCWSDFTNWCAAPRQSAAKGRSPEQTRVLEATTVRALAQSYAQTIHQGALTAIASHPGRVVFAGVHPGCNDFTMSWGACTERTIPLAGQGAGPRDPDFLEGLFDWVGATGGFKGALFATWDDWTEGSHFEPDVVDGPDRLVRARNRLGELYGDGADAAGETRLRDRWTGYGKVRGCAGTTITANPPGPGVPDLACATGTTGTITGTVTNVSTGVTARRSRSAVAGRRSRSRTSTTRSRRSSPRPHAPRFPSSRSSRCRSRPTCR
jgi:hypothetical protein